MAHDRTTGRNPGGRSRGFSLIELVIAIAVSAVVILTVSSILGRISRTRDVARVRLDAATRAGAALEAVRRDLVSVIRDSDLFQSRVLLLDGVGASAYGLVHRDEILVFNNRLRPMKRDDYAGEGGEYESQYRVEDDAAGSVLWMRRDAVPDENSEGGGLAIPAVEGVIGISIEAYDGEAWYPDWDSDFMGLPWALRIEVTATGDEPGMPASEGGKSLVTLRTQIAIDRIVPPPPPPPEDEELAAADAAANDAAGAGDPAAGAGGGGGAPFFGGGGGGGGGRGGDGGPRRPGGGFGQGGGGDGSVGGGGRRPGFSGGRGNGAIGGGRGGMGGFSGSTGIGSTRGSQR